MKRLISLLFCIAAALVLSAGCVKPPAYHARELDEARSEGGSVTLVASTARPQRKDVIIGRSASAGAVDGVAQCIAQGGPLGLLIAPLCAASGAASGGRAQLSPQETFEIVRDLEPAFAEAEMQDRLAARIGFVAAVAGRQVRTATEKGTATNEPTGMIIDAGVAEFGFFGLALEPDPDVVFRLTAAVRAVRPRDGLVLYTETYTYHSLARKVSAWAANGSDALKRELRAGLEDLGERIAEDLLFVHPIVKKPTEVGAGESEYDYCMLKPYTPAMPALRYLLPFDMMPVVDSSEVRPVETLQPVFQWQAFPRERDRREDKGKKLAGITSVNYDLRIWKKRIPPATEAARDAEKAGNARLDSNWPAELVYEKRGLAAAESVREWQETPVEVNETGMTKVLPPVTRREGIATFTLDRPLEPGTTYLWTVRARFVLDGRTRLTPWSRFQGHPEKDFCENSTNSRRYFIFKTPMLPPAGQSK